jgi:hypothetical protein
MALSVSTEKIQVMRERERERVAAREACRGLNGRRSGSSLEPRGNTGGGTYNQHQPLHGPATVSRAIGGLCDRQHRCAVGGGSGGAGRRICVVGGQRGGGGGAGMGMSSGEASPTSYEGGCFFLLQPLFSSSSSTSNLGGLRRGSMVVAAVGGL